MGSQRVGDDLATKQQHDLATKQQQQTIKYLTNENLPIAQETLLHALW